MPHIFHRAVSRREFLKTAVGAGAAFVTLGCASTFRVGQDKSVRLALLADTHICNDPKDNVRGLYPQQNLQKVVAEIGCDLPDGVVIAGDLARLEGKTGDYERLKEFLTGLAERSPIFMALGNHDDRANFYNVFKEHPGQKQAVRDKHVTVIDTVPVRFIVLDSLLYVNKVSGLLGKTQRDWLGSYLKQSDGKPTILCFHHTLRDRDGDLLDAPRLFDIIRPVRKVKAIIYGHSHEYGYAELDGIHLINLPATGYSQRDGFAVGWVEARLTARAGRFALHVVADKATADGAVKNLSWRT